MLKKIKVFNTRLSGEAPESALKKEVLINPEGILWVEGLPENLYGISVVDYSDREIRVIPPSRICKIRMMDGKIYEIDREDLSDLE